MCSVCGMRNGHRHNCPEADEPSVVANCYYCGSVIRNGETVFTDEDGNVYHEDCVHDCTMDILMECFGFKIGTIEE